MPRAKARIWHQQVSGIKRSRRSQIGACRALGADATLSQWIDVWSEIGVLPRFIDALSLPFSVGHANLAIGTHWTAPAMLVVGVEVHTPAQSQSSEWQDLFDYVGSIYLSDAAWFVPKGSRPACSPLDTRSFCLGSSFASSRLVSTDPVLCLLESSLPELVHKRQVVGGGMRLTLRHMDQRVWPVVRGALSNPEPFAFVSTECGLHQNLVCTMTRTTAEIGMFVERAMASVYSDRRETGFTFRSPKWTSAGVSEVTTFSPARHFADMSGERYRVSLAQLLHGLLANAGVELSDSERIVLGPNRQTVRIVRKLQVSLARLNLPVSSVQALVMRGLVESMAGASKFILDRYHLILIGKDQYELGALPLTDGLVSHAGSIEIDNNLTQMLVTNARFRAMVAKTLFLPASLVEATAMAAANAVRDIGLPVPPTTENTAYVSVTEIPTMES